MYNSNNTGLSVNNVNVLETVSPAEIWIGTTGTSWGSGLNYFDGTTITQINFPNNTDSYPESVYALKKMQDGKLWIGSTPYTYIYDGTTLTSLGQEGPMYAETFIEKDGIVWVGTAGYGLYKYDGTTWANYTTSNSGIPSNYVERMDIDSNNNLWMGGYGSQDNTQGLIKFDGTTFTNYTPANSNLPQRQMNDLIVDGQDNIWIANGNGDTPAGLVKFDGTDFTLWTPANSNLPVQILLDLETDNNGKLIISTYNHGLCYYQLATAAIAQNIQQDIKVYPNPAKDKITFDIPENDVNEQTTVTLIDTTGKIIQCATLTPYSKTLPVAGMAPGLYLYKLCGANNVMQTGKVIIE